MYLLIDDKRDIGADITARSAVAGKAVLAELSGIINCLGIDYDLGGPISGSDIIKWAANRGFLPKKVQIVSMNPPGRKAIQNALLDAGYRCKDSSNFVRES